MIRLTKKLLFAIEAVLDIAYNGGPTPVRSSEITERQGIPRRYLEPVLQELVRHKILLGIRGPSGGYRLARERRRISLGDVVRTVRGLETSEDPISDPAGSALGQRQAALRMLQAAGLDEGTHVFFPQAAKLERNRTGADSRQQIVGIAGRQDQNQVRRRLFEGLEQRVGGLWIGAIDAVD